MFTPRMAGDYSQPEVLRSRMEAAGLSHGQTVRANLAGVAVRDEPVAYGGFVLSRPTIFFCDVGILQVSEKIGPGDGDDLPLGVEISGLEVPDFGVFDLEDFVFSSNGDLLVRADRQSRIVPARNRIAAIPVLATLE